MWIALIGSVLAAVAAAIGGGLSYKATKDTNAQNQQNYDDWKDYNSPANQMNRLTSAGLNPYMVNGVSNTLSAPFSVENNQGLSSLFTQLSSAMSQGVGGMNTAERNDISRMNAQTNQKKLSLELAGLRLRERMVRINEKLGNAKAALLWSQGTIADLNAQFWRDVSDVRVNKYISDATISASNADFLSQFNPLRLGYYNEFYPLAIEGKMAQNQYTRRQISHLAWSEAFLQSKLEQEMALNWAKQSLATKLGFQSLWNNQDRVANEYELGSGRLDLQRQYYKLAKYKWLTDSYFRLRGQNMQILNSIFN